MREILYDQVKAALYMSRLLKAKYFATDNRINELDEASMRRFSYKIKFDYSGTSQIFALYNALLKPLCKTEIPPELERELKTFTKLTPGDFHSVRSQYNSLLSNEKTATHEILTNNPVEMSALQQATIVSEYADEKDRLPLFQILFKNF